MSARVALAIAGIWLAVPVAAEEPVRTNLRYDEDWSGEAEGPKNLLLDASGQMRLTLGIEVRARQESFANPMWGDTPDDGYMWLRLLPLADMHAGPARLFVQPIIGYARGVSGGNGPADQTGIDILQGFGDLDLRIGRDTKLTLRIGRELVALGSERLIGTRYGPNIPQAFDGVRAIVSAGPMQLDLMDLRPVEVGQGDFDDVSSGRRKLRAVYATVKPMRGFGVDLYWISFRNRKAKFAALSGQERRETYGIRLFGQRGRLSWNWEAMIQRGSFAGLSIRACSLAAESAIDFPKAKFSPRLRLRANYASGDSAADDQKLGTFNALFPKGRYFGELTPVGPRNIINLRPSIDFDVGDSVSLELSAAAFWRAALGDGVYDVPGQQIRPAGTSRSLFIGSQIESSVSWQATPTLSISGSLGRFAAGRFLRDIGKGAPIFMSAVEATYKF